MNGTILYRRERLQFKGSFIIPLEGSPCGGAAPAEVLEVPAGTTVEVAEDCASHVHDIPFHFTEASLRRRGKGLPFFASRSQLERAAIA